MTFEPRHQYAEVVDLQRRMMPDWYSWFLELVELINAFDIITQDHETRLDELETLVGSPATTVASLPSAVTVGAGARHFVTDANATTFLSVVAGGGANKVPVVSDGTNWLIG